MRFLGSENPHRFRRAPPPLLFPTPNTKRIPPGAVAVQSRAFGVSTGCVRRLDPVFFRLVPRRTRVRKPSRARTCAPARWGARRWWGGWGGGGRFGGGALRHAPWRYSGRAACGRPAMAPPFPPGRAGAPAGGAARVACRRSSVCLRTATPRGVGEAVMRGRGGWEATGTAPQGADCARPAPPPRQRSRK